MSKRLLAAFAYTAAITLCAGCAHSAGSPSSTPTTASSAAVDKQISAKAKTLKSEGDPKLEIISDLIEEFPEFVEFVEQTVEQLFADK